MCVCVFKPALGLRQKMPHTPFSHITLVPISFVPCLSQSSWSLSQSKRRETVAPIQNMNAAPPPPVGLGTRATPGSSAEVPCNPRFTRTQISTATSYGTAPPFGGPNTLESPTFALECGNPDANVGIGPLAKGLKTVKRRCQRRAIWFKRDTLEGYAHKDHASSGDWQFTFFVSGVKHSLDVLLS